MIVLVHTKKKKGANTYKASGQSLMHHKNQILAWEVNTQNATLELNKAFRQRLEPLASASQRTL